MMLFSIVSPIVFALLCSIPTTSASLIPSLTQDASRPVVQLDYGTFQGEYSSEYNLVYYRKIPFAASTAGANRFRGPQPPPPITDGVYDTDQSFELCPQRTVNGSEDCLYLGVYSRPWDKKTQSLRPVLVTFYNGGYLGTSETWSIPPAGYPVLDIDDRNDYVIVYANHRTSVFGYLAGAKIAEHPDVNLNPGLLDNKAALEWVQKYIHSFGGDKSNVTIWGQSASAGNVVAQVIATGNQGKELFSRAMANSPVWVKTFRFDSDWAEELYQHTIKYVGCTNATDEIKCLKEADVQLLRESAVALTRDPRYLVSTFTFAPVIDDKFLTKPLSEVLRAGTLNADAVLMSYSLYEGENFVPAGFANFTSGSDGFNSSAVSFDVWVKQYLPDLTPEDLTNLKKMYPETGEAEQISWNTTTVREGMVYRDNVIACPAYSLTRKAERGWLVDYTIPPAKHVSDAQYWNLVNPVQQTDRLTYQGYTGAMASFVQTGDANTHKLINDSVPSLPEAKENKQFLITPSGLKQGGVSMLEERCAFWASISDRLPG